MLQAMRAIDFAVSQALPEDLRRETYDLGKKGMAELMAEVASKHPDDFPEITKKLGDLGRRGAWLGGYTTGASDTRQVIDTKKYYAQMDAELAKLKKEKNLSPAEFDDRRSEIMTRYSDLIEKDTMAAAMKGRNNFALAVNSGARGNASHVKAILSTPGIFQDSKGKTIPLFVRNSFGDGVRPAETLAGTYGARTSVVSTKKATAKGGDLLKIMTQSTVNYGVSEKDCGVKNGVSADPNGEHITGRLLASPVGDIPAGTVIDRALLSKLRRRGKPVVVRSAMTCRAKTGLCSRCVGVEADGRFPNVGDSVGVTAAQAIGEPIVQGSLNCLITNTLVRMADFTTRPIQAVKPGEMVLGADTSGNTFPVKVLALHDQGLQPVQCYTYKMGSTKERISVVCTPDHPILQTTYYTGCREEELNYTPRKLPAGRGPGRPSAVLPVSAGRRAGYREPLALAVGYFMGDGIRWQSEPSSGRQHAITLSCACDSTEQDLQDHLALTGMKLKKCKRSHDWRVVLKRPGGGARNTFKQVVKRLGLSDLYCHEKQLPGEVWSWGDDSVLDLLAGFISADGSVYRSGSTVGVSFSSTSRDMLEGLRELLRVRFCVYTCPTTMTSEAGKNNYRHDMWAFTLTRRDQIRKLAPMITHRIPGEKGDKLERYLREANYTEKADGQPFYKAKRSDIEELGELHCWDISVDHPDELFVLANSLIVKNTKHTGGMAKARKEFSGLGYISQFLQVPEEFKDRAAVSEVAGTVEKVEAAPQGGSFITVNGEKHFALPGFEPLVKPGEKVEAGDALSEGLINPADIVRLRGLGEGRKYYAERLSQMLRDSGQNPDARNVEILARAALDNYLIDDPDEDSPWLPDDLVRESELLANYKPPQDTAELATGRATGKYLQVPALHYTVGTKVTPRIAKALQEAGVDRVSVAGEEPWFRPEMKRLRVASHDSDDWLASLGTSYLSSQMRTSLERGDETNIAENNHFGPRLAFGADAGAGAFGENIEQTGKF